MNKEFIVKKCNKCGTVVKGMSDKVCDGIACCGETMQTLVPNSVDASVEKHVPNYEVKDGRIYVTVNHVMEEDHYIEWISLVSEGRECTTYLKPGMEAKAHYKYTPNSTIYAYCNKHQLWKKDVE